VASVIHAHLSCQKIPNFTSFYAHSKLPTGHLGAKTIQARPIATMAILQQKSAVIYALLALHLPVTL
jgi:hypothetical protein